jgi:hypothetical protein
MALRRRSMTAHPSSVWRSLRGALSRGLADPSRQRSRYSSMDGFHRRDVPGGTQVWICHFHCRSERAGNGFRLTRLCCLAGWRFGLGNQLMALSVDSEGDRTSITYRRARIAGRDTEQRAELFICAWRRSPMSRTDRRVRVSPGRAFGMESVAAPPIVSGRGSGRLVWIMPRPGSAPRECPADC